MDVAKNTVTTQLPEEIRALLSALRWRIRAYVWLEGLSLALVWLGLTFWVGLALDYLPVLLGAGEMPRGARALLLGTIAAILGWILYRWILRRTFVRLADRNMAVLLERRYGHFHDSLITSVELGAGDAPVRGAGEEMLAETESAALRDLGGVRLAGVFNARPLAFSMLGALFLLGTMGMFYAANASAFWLGVDRMYRLHDTPWPRNAKIEVVGITVPREFEETDQAAEEEVVPFVDRRVKVARGSAVILKVRADGGRKVPDVCTIYYRTGEGDRGRVNMTRVGGIRKGYQPYVYDGKPLMGITSDVAFDVLGFDHRLRGYTIEVVEAPVLVGAQLTCTFPPYMVDEELSLWLPRTMDLTAGTQLPRGTDVTIRARSNKPLWQVEIRNEEGRRLATLDADQLSNEGREFEYRVASLDESQSLLVTLIDRDNVRSQRDHRLHLAAIEDQPPNVEVGLQGIGTAVTPDVLIPLRGQVTDDYGVAACWAHVAVNESAGDRLPVNLEAGGELAAEIDFRALRNEQSLRLEAGHRLNLVVEAEDRFNLLDAANVGRSDHTQLEVVEAGELLSRLEARELGLRKRFEQIIQEVTLMRKELLHVQNEGPEQETPGADPLDRQAADDAVDEQDPEADAAEGDAPAADADPPARDAARQRLEDVWRPRLRRAQQALLQSQKSAQETRGVAVSFELIREELINNRIDTEDRKQRLRAQISEPLHDIADTLFPELDRRLEQLAEAMNDLPALAASDKEDPQTEVRVQAALDQTNDILLAMDEVLQNMLELESYNDLLDLVRGLINDQEDLIEDTKQQQRKQVLELLQ